MDAISDRTFQPVDDPAKASALVDELPSLLTVIIDINPLKWFELRSLIDIREVTKSICIMLNAHLALNSSNKVAVLVANNFSDEKNGAKFLYPIPKQQTELTRDNNNNKFDANMYRQFRGLDEAIVNELNELLMQQETIVKEQGNYKNSMSGAFSMALSYINKISRGQEHLLKSRILVLSVSDDNTLPYISTMNCIFAAQKMKIPIDVVKLGSASVFLQQASDSTSGVYQLIKKPKGLIQYLSSAFFIDPSLRAVLILPTDSKIDFRASCFITNEIINIGYVCSVCLCILSIVPNDTKCPICDSQFDEAVIKKLRQKPALFLNKKKKTH